MSTKINEYNKALKKGALTRHVVKRNDKWVVLKPSASRASVVKKTQKEAIRSARKMVEKSHARVVVHNSIGRIREII